MEARDGREREYLVWVRIDGAAYRLRITAASQREAARRPGMDLHAGAPRDYGLGEDRVRVIWANVATLEVGPVHRAGRPRP